MIVRQVRDKRTLMKLVLDKDKITNYVGPVHYQGRYIFLGNITKDANEKGKLFNARKNAKSKDE